MNISEYKNLVLETSLDDYAGLLNLGRKFKKIDDVSFNTKIAFIGTNSIQLIVSTTRALLVRSNIVADVYEGEYNGILLDVLDANSSLYKFQPQYIVMIPDYRDVEKFLPNVLSSEEDVDKAVKEAVAFYNSLFAKIHSALPSSQILLSNFVVPYNDSLGNLSANILSSQTNFYRLLNLELVKSKPLFVNILDAESLASYIGKSNWFDESGYFLNKSGFALQYVGFFSDLIVRQIEAFNAKAKKCIVLDLDNTLWGGIVGDLGYDGINLDPNDAIGESFIAFQKELLKLKNRGVILAVVSKNDYENAIEPFRKNPNMVLKENDISAFIANWSDKASNMRAIAKELNLGIDSFVFFDDNPTERALIKQFIPEVKVIDVPEDPALYAHALYEAHAFDWTSLTSEDIERSKSYIDNKQRDNLLESSVDYDDYLKKLEMKILLERVNEKTIARFVQLTNKSNQFNLRTIRYTDSQVDEMYNDDSYELLAVSLSDKFSNYGIIACVVLKFENKECFIENWVMSCRVLKKCVENYTIEKIVEIAKAHGAKTIKGEYLVSNKNGMVKDLYETLGFEKLDDNHYVLSEDKMKDYKQNYHFEEEK